MKSLSSYCIAFVITITATLLLPEAQAGKGGKSKGPDPYYTVPTYFFPKPDSRSKTWKVPNFGPVGIGLHLEKPNFTMKIVNIEKGSPADKSGKLKPGQIIESVNGEVLKDQDPRILLANWITRAEATDGKIELKIKGEGDVRVQIPVLGRYSPTWPENCPKSDKIVRNLADRIAKGDGDEWGAVLFLLSTGEDKDLEVVKRWMKSCKTVGPYPWHKGYQGPGLCEYYLRTGDKSILPVIKQMTEELKDYWYNDAGWSGRGNASFSYGQLNAAGVHCLNFLLMAKRCGVDVDEYMLQKSLRHFYRYAGHGTLAYGNHMPNAGFRDNGKVAGLAVAMGSAALLTPEGEKSVYAQARDNSAMKSFYATNWFHAAHTGGGMGEIWRNATMCMMKDKRPVQYRSFLDTRQWVMDLSRRWDGGIGIAGVADRYDKATGEQEIAYGNYFALTYTIPRKHLQMFGAPPSPYAVHFQLPERPWGTPADDQFQSLKPGPNPAITMEDLLAEKVETDSSYSAMRGWWGGDLKDERIHYYLNHPEYGLRQPMALTLGEKGRADIITELLKSDDPRLRACGLSPINGYYKGKTLDSDKLTKEMRDLVETIYTNPDESWWVRINAIYALRRWGPEMIAKHKDQLLQELRHDDWWFQYAALITLSDIAMDPKHHKDVLPAIAELFGKTRVGRIIHHARTFDKLISKADQKVQAFAMPYFKSSFDEVPRQFIDPVTGYLMKGGSRYARTLLARILVDLPGGVEVGRTDPKTTLQSAISGKDQDMYVFDGRYTPDRSLVGKWVEQIEIMPGEFDTITKGVEKKKAWREGIRKEIAKKEKARGEKITSGPLLRRIRKNYLDLQPDGSVAKSKLLFWTDKMLIDNELGEARRMERYSQNGKTYLLVEKGNFAPVEEPRSEEDTEESTEGDAGPSEGEEPLSELRPAGWHCGYLVYEREE